MDQLVLIKLLIAMVVVVGLSAIVEYGNAKLAGILSAYPLGTAIVLFFFGYEVSPSFAAQSAVFSLPGFVCLLVLLLTYWQISLRVGGVIGVAASALGGVGAFVALSALFQSVSFTLVTGTLLAVAGMIGFGWLFSRIENVNVSKRVPFSLGVLAFRSGTAGLVVIAITGAAELLGPQWSGLFAGFPITLFPLLIVLHATYGTDPVHTIIKNFPIGLGSLIVYSICIATLYERYGIALGTVISFAVATAYLVVFTQILKRIRG